MTSYLIQGASLLGAKAADLGVLSGAFMDASEVAGLKKTRVIDAAGLVALPGLVDLHTHVRQPGGEQAETVRSGSRAAALGGYTAIHAMANTRP